MTRGGLFGRGPGVAALGRAFLAGCALQTGTVVLLPEKDGRNAAVTVRQGTEEVVLEEPYAAARQTTQGPRAYKSSPEEVQALFGPALAAQPGRPTSFTLYFVEGGDEFTDASRQILDNVFAEIAKHPVPDIVVVGHTDAVGSDTVNDALALRRADDRAHDADRPRHLARERRGRRSRQARAARADARRRCRTAQSARRDRRPLTDRRPRRLADVERGLSRSRRCRLRADRSSAAPAP